MEQLTLEIKMDIFKWKQYESAIILSTQLLHFENRDKPAPLLGIKTI
jgi:hypothetical protein